MKDELVTVSVGLLKNSLGLKNGENFLIVTDDEKRDLAEAVYEAGKRIGAETILMVMQLREKSGQEPPLAVGEAMKQADVVLCVTTYSLTHTQARKNAVKEGARLATMPGITEDMFLHGAVAADYRVVKGLTERVTELLTAGKQVRIEKEGRVLTFSIDGRSGIASTGVYLNPGESGNLPSGEGYIAPIEGSANGEIVVDGSIASVGKVKSPLVLKIRDGRIAGAEGEDAETLLGILGDGDGRLLGEFGIGTNDKARVTGVVLEDEKVYGTIHVAFGNNHTFGGTVQAGVHIDLVVKNPVVYIDELKVLENGKLLV